MILGDQERLVGKKSSNGSNVSILESKRQRLETLEKSLGYRETEYEMACKNIGTYKVQNKLVSTLCDTIKQMDEKLKMREIGITFPEKR